MSTGQSLLDRMEIVNQELQLQAGEADVTRGLIALNVAQDYFESLVALRRGALGSTGSGNEVIATGATETTAFPSGLLRLDRLQTLSGTGGTVNGELRKLQRTGGHAGQGQWPYNSLITGSGRPTAYYTDGSKIYWAPLPDGTYYVRYYGFKAASDITASGTFAYPDIVMFPLAAFATRILKLGVDDPAQDVSGVAQETFKTVIDTLANFNRDGATGFEYTEIHSA